MQQLERRVDTLQDVVEGLSETFVGVNDALVRSGYLARDRQVAEVLRKSMEKFLALSKIAQQDVDDGVEETGEQDAGERSTGALAPSPRCGSESGPETRDSSEQLILTRGAAQQQISLRRTRQKPHTVWFRPRLGYSVWSDAPFQWSSQRATNNVLHYIAAGHDSFPARLYWNSLTFAFRSLRGDEDFPIDFAKSMFRYKIRYSTPQQILTVIGHVLNQMLLGTGDFTFDESRTADIFTGQKTLGPSETGAVETDAVKNAIHRDIIQDGGLVDDYLDTWAVERYIANQWAVLVNSSTARLLQRNLVVDIDPLLERLVNAAVTIGEGPRYPIRDIDMAVQSFLTETQSMSGTA